jgi:hypothetical protein
VILGIGAAERRAAIAADEHLGTVARDQDRLVPQRGGPSSGEFLEGCQVLAVAGVVVAPTDQRVHSTPVSTGPHLDAVRP